MRRCRIEDFVGGKICLFGSFLEKMKRGYFWKRIPEKDLDAIGQE